MKSSTNGTKVKLTDLELEAVHAIFEKEAHTLSILLQLRQITPEQYRLYELLYDKIMYILEERELH